MSGTWPVIAAMTLVTFVPRVAPMLLLPGMRMPRIAERWLSLIAPSILSALLLPELLLDRSAGLPSVSFPSIYLIASLPAFLVAWRTKSLFGAVAAGITAAAFLRLC